MSHTYRLNETTVKDKDGIVYTFYGIDAVNKKGKIVKSFVNVFVDRNKAETLVALCYECELSLVHLANVVEDAIYEQSKTNAV